METPCPACGSTAPAGSAYCQKCGRALGLAEIDARGIAEGLLRTIVSLYAVGASEERIFEEMSIQAPSGLDLRGGIERVGRWQRFYLRAVRDGWMEQGPGTAGAEWSIAHFMGNTQELEIAMEYLPLWIQSSGAVDVVRDMTGVYVAQGARPDHAAYARAKLCEHREPVASIALALWDSQPQRANRQEAAERMAATSQPQKSTGCALLLGAIITAFGLGGLGLMGVWCVTS